MMMMMMTVPFRSETQLPHRSVSEGLGCPMGGVKEVTFQPFCSLGKHDPGDLWMDTRILPQNLAGRVPRGGVGVHHGYPLGETGHPDAAEGPRTARQPRLPAPAAS